VQKLLMARWLTRAALLSVLSATFVAAQAQAPTQPAKPVVAPPPTDLEPGVNTSAIQPSSEEPAAPTPKPARRATSAAAAGNANSASTAASRGGTASAGAAPASSAAATPGTATAGSGSSAASGTATESRAAAAATGAAAGGARTTAAPKSGAAPGKAHDRIELDTTQITGNRELPKVLYIVPWKRSDLGDLVGRPVNSLLDEVLTPVDRDVFKRQNRYYDALKPDEAKDAAGAVAGPTEKH
jgi:hypothetical protein